MLLHDLVTTSAAVAEGSSRLAKIGLLADLLRRLAPHEIDIAIGFLSGEPRQGRIGIGGAVLRGLEISSDRHTVYVKPELVVEIAFNEVQESSQYPGGLALRFARVKGYRPDKSAAEADTIDTVRDIYLRSV
jgi:ATP-dependent DNA ligase